MNANTQKIINEINSIPGLKILTMSDRNSLDITEDGEWSHLLEFSKTINKSLNHKSNFSIVVRQFTSEYIDVNKNNRILNLPKKNIYMLYITNGNYRWLNDEQCFECYYRNYIDGTILEIEPDITCCGFYKNC